MPHRNNRLGIQKTFKNWCEISFMLHFYNMETLSVLCVISFCCIPENWVNLTFFLTLHENVSHVNMHPFTWVGKVPWQSSLPITSHSQTIFWPAFMSTSEINKPCYFASRIIRTRSCPYNFFGTTCSLGAVLMCTQIGVFLGSLRFTLSKNFPKAGHPVLSAQSSPALFFAFAFHYRGGSHRGPVCSCPVFSLFPSALASVLKEAEKDLSWAHPRPCLVSLLHSDFFVPLASLPLLSGFYYLLAHPKGFVKMSLAGWIADEASSPHGED